MAILTTVGGKRGDFLDSGIGRIYLYGVAVVGSFVLACFVWFVLSLPKWIWSGIVTLLFKIPGYGDFLASYRESVWIRLLTWAATFLVLVIFVAIVDQNRKKKAIAKRVTVPPKVELIPRVSRKALVICIDGTGDYAAEVPTNVFRLYQALPNNEQIVSYYDGGVGTLQDFFIRGELTRKLWQATDLALGYSLRMNVCDAYRFIVENLEDEDQPIYLFGFSRGAYACRVLAGMIEQFGVPNVEQAHLVPYIWQAMQSLQPGVSDDTVASVRNSYICRQPRIEFIGIWDTVSSVGFLRQRVFRGAFQLGNCKYGRHAMAIDEHRNMFPENLCNSLIIAQRWFPGVHRDVGGGGGTPGSEALSNIPYMWVTDPIRNELGIDASSLPTDAAAPWNQNDLLTVVYGVAGFIPQRIWTRGFSQLDSYRWHWFRFAHRRRFAKGTDIDPSVLERVEKVPGYFPKFFVQRGPGGGLEPATQEDFGPSDALDPANNFSSQMVEDEDKKVVQDYAE